jgi:hypothetical protein
MLLSLIILCELAFWVLLLSALFARYLLNLRRTSSVLLVCVPLVDVVLLIATVLDLSRGSATATFAHGLAALYIGFTAGFGKTTIRWADEWFAYQFASGPRPKALPSRGPEHVRNEWRLFGRALLAYSIAGTLIVTALYLVGDATRTEHLSKWLRVLTVSATLWLLFGPVYSTLFRRSDQAPGRGHLARNSR